MGPTNRLRRANGTDNKSTGIPPTNPAQKIFDDLEKHAVVIRTRRRQKLAISPDQDDTLYIVRRGILLAHATLPGNRNQILGILIPGDIYRSTAMPPLSGAALTSATDQGEIWRMRWSTLTDLAASDPSVAHLVCHQLTEQAARLALHSAIVGGLTGEERVASLYTELALRVGKPAGGGVSFDMPLSRVDVAEYLALNADTVSRIVSRMRVKGLIAEAGRGRIICRDMAALAQECPVTKAFEQLSKSAAPVAA